MQATIRQSGETVPYTPGSAKTAGDVILQGTLVGVVVSSLAANERGALQVGGVVNVPKDSTDMAAGVAVYWDADGSPVGGVALSGAFTTSASGNTLAGKTIEAAGTTVGNVDILLTP